MRRLLAALDIDIEKQKEEVDDYEFTCQTIIATDNVISYNFRGKSYQGKSMKTSSSNTIQPDTVVTPDLVIEVPQGDSIPEPYHAVNEIKVNIPADKSRWIKCAEQLKKYDDDLENWVIPCTSYHDLMFTTNPNRTHDFQNYIEQLDSAGTLTFTRKISILESSRQVRRQTFMFIKKDSGAISNRNLDEKLSTGVSVNLEHIVNEINQMKFYDVRPPVVHTMMIIWDHVLPTFINQEQFNALKGNKTIAISVTVEAIREKLARFAPDPENSCIRRAWVAEALQGFCELGAARPLFLEKEEEFEIKFKRHKDENWIYNRVEEVRKLNEKAGFDRLDKFI